MGYTYADFDSSCSEISKIVYLNLLHYATMVMLNEKYNKIVKYRRLTLRIPGNNKIDPTTGTLLKKLTATGKNPL